MLIFICAVCINYISASDLRKNLLGKHVLLAEDNDLNAEIAVTVLEEKGLVIERVKDGVQCLNRIEQMLQSTWASNLRRHFTTMTQVCNIINECF